MWIQILLILYIAAVVVYHFFYDKTPGCTNQTCSNYNPNANINDDSCKDCAGPGDGDYYLKYGDKFCNVNVASPLSNSSLACDGSSSNTLSSINIDFTNKKISKTVPGLSESADLTYIDQDDGTYSNYQLGLKYSGNLYILQMQDSDSNVHAKKVDSFDDTLKTDGSVFTLVMA